MQQQLLPFHHSTRQSHCHHITSTAVHTSHEQRARHCKQDTDLNKRSINGSGAGTGGGVGAAGGARDTGSTTAGFDAVVGTSGDSGVVADNTGTGGKPLPCLVFSASAYEAGAVAVARGGLAHGGGDAASDALYAAAALHTIPRSFPSVEKQAGFRNLSALSTEIHTPIVGNSSSSLHKDPDLPRLHPCEG